eukprot:10367681-Alexandrium_andersonii.AAC.1
MAAGAAWHRVHLASRAEAARFEQESRKATSRLVNLKRGAWKTRLADGAKGLAAAYRALQSSRLPPIQFIRGAEGE